MQSKNKTPMTAAERRHVSVIRGMACVVCDEPGPNQAHEPEQGYWYISIPLCDPCHTLSEGWHGNRNRWKNRKMTELKAINLTLAAVLGSKQ